MKSKQSTKKMVLGAVLTAIVIVLQLLGAFIKLGPFSVSLVLIPIVIGASLCGIGIGAFLGFIFGLTVLLSGDAGAFLAVNPLGTVLVVLLKGTACGAVAGAVYKALYKKNEYLAVLMSAIACPVTNTAVFLIGCKIFFMDTISGWASAANFGANTAGYIIAVLVGFNFLFEILVNIILCPVTVRLINTKRSA